MEIQCFQKLSSVELKTIKGFLQECVILDLNSEIKKKAIEFRIKYKLKLPDAIIAATTNYLDLPLVSSDKIFLKVEELNLVRFL